jgi:hypothetical protein
MDEYTEGALYMYLGLSYYCAVGRNATPRQCLLMGGILYQNYYV